MIQSDSHRSRAIEFYRFLFSLVVCLFHFRVKGGFAGPNGAFNGGYLGVEFFSILSGCFLMETIQRGRIARAGGALLPDLVSGYALRRFARLYPHYLLTLASFIAMRICILRTLSVKEFLKNGFFECFMLQSFGDSYVVLPFWFVSALFLGSVLLYWLGLALGDHFPLAMSFLSPLIFSLFYEHRGTLDRTQSPALAGSEGFWRMVAGLGVGCVAFCLVQRLRPFVRERFAPLSAALELGLLAALLLLMERTYHSTWDFIVIALLALLIGSVLLGNSLLTRLLDNPASAFLGKISYGIYLNQCFFLHLFGPVFPVQGYWRTAAVFLALNILLSTLTCYLSQALAGLAGRLLRRLSEPPPA